MFILKLLPMVKIDPVNLHKVNHFCQIHFKTLCMILLEVGGTVFFLCEDVVIEVFVQVNKRQKCSWGNKIQTCTKQPPFNGT